MVMAMVMHEDGHSDGAGNETESGGDAKENYPWQQSPTPSATHACKMAHVEADNDSDCKHCFLGGWPRVLSKTSSGDMQNSVPTHPEHNGWAQPQGGNRASDGGPCNQCCSSALNVEIAPEDYQWLDWGEARCNPPRYPSHCEVGTVPNSHWGSCHEPRL